MFFLFVFLSVHIMSGKKINKKNKRHIYLSQWVHKSLREKKSNSS